MEKHGHISGDGEGRIGTSKIRWAVEVTVMKCQKFYFIKLLGFINIFLSVTLWYLFAYGTYYDARLSNLRFLFNYEYITIALC